MLIQRDAFLDGCLFATRPTEVAQKIRNGSEVALLKTASSATLFTGRGKQRFLLDQYMMFIILFDCLLCLQREGVGVALKRNKGLIKCTFPSAAC